MRAKGTEDTWLLLCPQELSPSPQVITYIAAQP